MTSITTGAASAVKRRRHRRPGQAVYAPYLFLAPFFILFLTFSLFPLLFSIYLSFQEWNPVAGLGTMEFVGLENYGLALTDPWFWKALGNTFWLAFVSGIPQHLIALPIAFLLVTVLNRLRQVFSAALFTPFVTSTVAVSLIFFSMYSPNAGVINQTLVYLSEAWWSGWAFGWVADAMPIRWLRDTALVKPAVAFVVVWKYTGFNVVIYTTGLMTISNDLYEAATIDGATLWQRFRHISLPLLKPFIFFAVTLTLIGNLQLFEEPFILTQGTGGTSNAALTVPFYLYKVGWEWLEMGPASAISWLLFLVIGAFTAVHFWVFGREGVGDAT